MNNAVIYTDLNCNNNYLIKTLLRNNNISYVETIVGQDIIKENVQSLFPNYSGSTVVAINGTFVGGLNELTEWLRSQPTFLAG